MTIDELQRLGLIPRVGDKLPGMEIIDVKLVDDAGDVALVEMLVKVEPPSARLKLDNI